MNRKNLRNFGIAALIAGSLTACSQSKEAEDGYITGQVTLTLDRSASCEFSEFGSYKVRNRPYSESGVSLAMSDIDRDGDQDMILFYAVPGSLVPAGSVVICENKMPQKSTTR